LLPFPPPHEYDVRRRSLHSNTGRTSLATRRTYTKAQTLTFRSYRSTAPWNTGPREDTRSQEDPFAESPYYQTLPQHLGPAHQRFLAVLLRMSLRRFLSLCLFILDRRFLSVLDIHRHSGPIPMNPQPSPPTPHPAPRHPTPAASAEDDGAAASGRDRVPDDKGWNGGRRFDERSGLSWLR
jgi:hypothetical protein